MIPCDAQVPWSVSSHSRLWKIHIKQGKMLYSLIFNVYMFPRYLRKENISRNEGERGDGKNRGGSGWPGYEFCLHPLAVVNYLISLKVVFLIKEQGQWQCPSQGWLVSCVSYSIGPSREGWHLRDSRPPPVLSHFHTLCSRRTFCWRGYILGAQPGARHL